MEPNPSLVRDVWEIIRYPLVFLMGLIGWNLKRSVERLDRVESCYVDEDTFNETVASFRSDIKDGFKEVREDIKDVHTRINNQNDKSRT